MGSKSSNTTTKVKADPWEPVRGPLKGVLPDLASLYQSGGFANDPYTGARVAGPGSATRASWDSVLKQAQMPNAANQAAGSLSAMMDGGSPYAGVTVPGSSPYSDVGALGRNPFADMRGGIPGLAGMMSGDNIYRDLDAVKANALADAVPAAAAMFSGSGMLNSGMAMDTVGRAATEAVAPIEYGAWDAAQSRALQAAGLDANTRLAAASGTQAHQGMGLERDLAIAGGRQNADQFGTQAALTRAGGIQDGTLSAAGMIPQLMSAGYLPGQMLSQVGGQQDAFAQRGIDADMAKWFEQQGVPRENIQGYLNALLAMGGQGSGGSTTAPGPSTAANVAGAGLGGLATYGTLAGIPGIGPPLAIGGGILAGLTGLL